jgi:hypothetical protein
MSRHMYPRTFVQWSMDDSSLGRNVPEQCVPTLTTYGTETIGQLIRRLAVMLRHALTATLFSLVSQGYI